MKNEIEKNAEYLLALAIKKCENLDEAEDLTQETLLCAYETLAKGKQIDNVKAWLSSTLHHKYYDMLRRKYKLPTVSIDNICEIASYQDETEYEEPIKASEVRKQVAYLAGLYREVISKHYLMGKSVKEISEELKIPTGTVLSRLSSGREQLRKGLTMKKYNESSYQPMHLDVTCNGRPGINNEPWSLVEENMMKQNILICAYEKPVTCIEIAEMMGIPVAYIEEAVDALIEGELMQRDGKRVYTDFLITTPEDLTESLDITIELAKDYFEDIWNMADGALMQVRSFSWYDMLTESCKAKMEYYFLLDLLSGAIYKATSKVLGEELPFPDRKNGGKWIAQGHKFSRNFDFSKWKNTDYMYGGERWELFDDFMGEKAVHIHIYDAPPDQNKYSRSDVPLDDGILCKLLYVIHKKLEYGYSGLDCVYLKTIPHLEECGILKNENGEVCVDIPILTADEWNEIFNFTGEKINELIEYLEKPFKEQLLPKLKRKIPKHLEGRISENRKYYPYNLTMVVIKEAINRGKFLKGVDFPAPPMLLVIESR